MIDKKQILIDIEDKAIELGSMLDCRNNLDTPANKLRGWMNDEEKDCLGTLKVNLAFLRNRIDEFLKESI